MSAEPLVGAWMRTGLIVGGARVPERCDVLWLQTADTFADIRIPRQPTRPDHGPAAQFYRPRAFAGVARWEDPAVAWDHFLDSDQPPAPDTGTLDISTVGRAYEDGTFLWDGVKIAFREEWELISAPGDPAQATVSPGRIRVTIGPRRIDVTEGRPDGCFRAERQQRRGDSWETVGVVTDA